MQRGNIQHYNESTFEHWTWWKRYNGDPCNLIAVVTGKEVHGYKLGMKDGILRGLYTRNQFELSDSNFIAIQCVKMGNQMRKHIPEKDFEYLEKHTDFQKPDIMEFYKEFMGVTKESSSDFADNYFRAADRDKSGKIDFKEFLLFLNHECTADPVEKLNWVFDLFDIDGNGTIEKPEMIKIYKTVLALRKKRSKYDTTPEQIAEKMFEICDKNVDDKLTKVEFITTFMEDPVLYAIFCGTMTEEDDEDT
ncbi:unnamed protein product [Mytilus edulis]|uniref:EF-hand domain-containing protein n=1 Tax=Mytilus edulis TaxID=6550 RepID=A0A8S3RK44_MYTED|nr:unnamed protein product [Mytilus edulis]